MRQQQTGSAFQRHTVQQQVHASRAQKLSDQHLAQLATHAAEVANSTQQAACNATGPHAQSNATVPQLCTGCRSTGAGLLPHVCRGTARCCKLGSARAQRASILHKHIRPAIGGSSAQASSSAPPSFHRPTGSPAAAAGASPTGSSPSAPPPAAAGRRSSPLPAARAPAQRNRRRVAAPRRRQPAPPPAAGRGDRAAGVRRWAASGWIGGAMQAGGQRSGEAASSWADLSEPRLLRLPPGRWRVRPSRCSPMGVQPRGSWGGEGGAAGQGLPAAGPRAAAGEHACNPIHAHPCSCSWPGCGSAAAPAASAPLQALWRRRPLPSRAQRLQRHRHLLQQARWGGNGPLSRGRSGWVLATGSQGPGAGTNAVGKRSGR